jgi:hypothetical protein
VHLGLLFQFGDLFQVLDQPLDQFEPFVDVGIFSTTEDDREHDLVFLFQELFGPVDLSQQVVIADFRSQAELLVLAVMGVALVLPLLLLVLELAKVHDAANGWLLLRRDFHKIEPGFASPLQCLTGFDNAEHGAVQPDDTDW